MSTGEKFYKQAQKPKRYLKNTLAFWNKPEVTNLLGVLVCAFQTKQDIEIQNHAFINEMNF